MKGRIIRAIVPAAEMRVNERGTELQAILSVVNTQCFCPVAGVSKSFEKYFNRYVAQILKTSTSQNCILQAAKRLGFMQVQEVF